MINEKRKSSVHLDMETLENNQPIVIEKTLNHSTEGINRRSGVNCSFTAYYGRKSPVAKRRREDDNDDSRKMKTFVFDPTDDPSYETETLVLSDITEIVKEKEMNEIIHKFSPVIRNFPDQIKKEMLESTVDWTERKNIFIGAIKYVIKGREDEPNKESELEETSIERLSEILIREIENRMPKHCRQCNMYYAVNPTDCPELHCMGCKVGMHDCTKMNLMKGRPGIKWLCETCEPMFNTHYLSKFDSLAIFEGFETNNLHKTVNKVTESEKEIEILVSQETIQPVKTIRMSKRMEMEQKEMDKIQVVAEIHRTENETKDNNGTNSQPLPQTNKTNNAKRNQVAPIVHPADNTPTSGSMLPNYKDVKKFPNLNKNKVCPFLTKGICRYGAKGENQAGKCDKYHPNQCRAYNSNSTRDNGCKNGNKCSEWHAIYVCHSSANSKTCNRPECPFKHHRDCTVNKFENFLESHNPHLMPRQHQGPDFPILHQRQSQHQHQHQRRHGPPIINHRQHSQFNRHPPHVPTDHLVHMIRTILREESNYQYQTRL